MNGATEKKCMNFAPKKVSLYEGFCLKAYLFKKTQFDQLVELERIQQSLSFFEYRNIFQCLDFTQNKNTIVSTLLKYEGDI